MQNKPQILDIIEEFIKLLINPKGLKGDSFPIEEIQLAAITKSVVFKWYVTADELQEAAAFIGDDIENDTLYLSVGEFDAELALLPEDRENTMRMILSK
ncbi:MAG: hypothetical protein IM631_05165 [Cytophagales bacterium]|jgi:hypothetical protein|nr:hypothetical protein [Cytophagales bacterium]MCA6370771.1 hypothetical protein [Cytophagales bacterium]MCA6385933.1 hypothetical protein [Cytophagales bacterium]